MWPAARCVDNISALRARELDAARWNLLADPQIVVPILAVAVHHARLRVRQDQPDLFLQFSRNSDVVRIQDGDELTFTVAQAQVPGCTHPAIDPTGAVK